MKKQITEEEIIKISTGEKDIKDIFPEVFEPKLEAGKWYKTDYGHLKFFINETTAFGFNSDGTWRETQTGFNLDKDIWILATPEEVEEALIKEAKRRGYVYGVYFKDVHTKSEFILSNLHYEEDSNDLKGQLGCVFYNGKWAEIISKPIKKYEDLKDISGYFVTSYGVIYKNTTNENLVTCKTHEQAEALITLAQLSQLIPEYNGDWVADFSYEKQMKYCIIFCKNELEIHGLSMFNYFLAFKTREIAEEFLQNNRELILKAKPFLG